MMVASVCVSCLILHALLAVLGFHGLVQAVAPLPAEHRPAGELVDDDDAELVVLRAGSGAIM